MSKGGSITDNEENYQASRLSIQQSVSGGDFMFTEVHGGIAAGTLQCTEGR